jgi:hypothetical protein
MNPLLFSCLFFLLFTAYSPLAFAQTCGNGIPGDKKCADPTLCCSKWGYCGSGPDFCSSNNPKPTASPGGVGTCGNGSVGNGGCKDAGYCCSKWGYCGPGPAFCEGNASSPAPKPTTPPSDVNIRVCGNGDPGIGVCPEKDHCCSKWGYCGTGKDYCGSNVKFTKSPTRRKPVRPPTKRPTRV